MRAAVAAVEAEHGAVGALVNNAGYSQSGALETLPMERLRAQFETNVFGLVRMCQLVLPGMRAAGRGRIVNVSSMGGKLVFPGGGAYHASKYAVEALSDALRFEVRGFGIRVVIVEPGLITTSFGETAAGSLARRRPPTTRRGRRRPVRELQRRRRRGDHRRLRGPDEAARRRPGGRRADDRAGDRGSQNPKPRYKVTASARLALGQRGCSPTAPGTRSCAASSRAPASSGPRLAGPRGAS